MTTGGTGMDERKGREEVSLIGRLFSMEALLFLMGVMSLAYGIFGGGTSREVNIFFGIVIVVGVVLLHKVRKKDWKKHWEEQEAMREAYLRRKEAERDRMNGGPDDAGKK
jgi:hypothetical protein